MPRVKSKRELFFTLCAVSAALAGCGDEPIDPPLGVDRDSVVVPDEEDEGRLPVQPIDGPENLVPPCQSQFFGVDPLALEPSARSCSLSLAVPVLNPGNVLVKIAGQARAAGDGENGWALLADGSSVLLLGLACDEVIAGADVELSALCE